MNIMDDWQEIETQTGIRMQQARVARRAKWRRVRLGLYLAWVALTTKGW